VTAWPEILDRGNASYGRFGKDATWPLVRSALDQMRAVEPEPTFLLLTGDLLAHRFRDLFDAAVPLQDRELYDGFVLKTVSFLAQEITRRFPGKRVFLALGNNDDYCGDYMLSPDGPFLADTQRLARRLLQVSDSERFDHGWDTGRGYDVANGAIPGLRMIFLNSVFFAPGYDQACAPAAVDDPGGEAMSWLASRLASAERAGDRVWLLMHIPPGADAYATLMHGGCAGGVRAMWTAPETEWFVHLLVHYRRTVAAVFAGHTHMDEFRLVGQDASRQGVVLVTPGTSPIFGQNPGFDVYSHDPAGRLVDRETWALNNLAEAGPFHAPAWSREYRFFELWGGVGLDAPGFADLAQRIGDDPAARAAWYSAFRVGRTAAWDEPGGPARLPASVFQAYRCAMTDVAPEAYRRCLCGETDPVTRQP